MHSEAKEFSNHWELLHVTKRIRAASQAERLPGASAVVAAHPAAATEHQLGKFLCLASSREHGSENIRAGCLS